MSSLGTTAVWWTRKIIELVAGDSAEYGLLGDAVRLYDLASKHARVLELLSQVIAAAPLASKVEEGQAAER